VVEVDKLEGHLAGLEEIWPLYEGLEGWSKVVADWLRNPQHPTREGFPDLLTPHLWVAAACESGRYPQKRSPERGICGGRWVWAFQHLWASLFLSKMALASCPCVLAALCNRGKKAYRQPAQIFAFDLPGEWSLWARQLAGHLPTPAW